MSSDQQHSYGPPPYTIPPTTVKTLRPPYTYPQSPPLSSYVLPQPSAFSSGNNSMDSENNNNTTHHQQPEERTVSVGVAKLERLQQSMNDLEKMVATLMSKQDNNIIHNMNLNVPCDRSVQEYVDEFYRLLARTASCDLEESEDNLIAKFVVGLRVEIKDIVSPRRFRQHTLPNAIRLATLAEQMMDESETFTYYEKPSSVEEDDPPQDNKNFSSRIPYCF
ncbi:hypothetical protein LWI29_025027 [Acer saccharum]|uniref:Uncharacterized protein n=1 Tax=Acer saccharum TaxID=4024 RepID=A0AA39VLI3_ACESA|nr:hypothetical protein LWI29_025027 [Acer saccharum]